MRKTMSKNLTQKIIIAIVIVISFNFTVPNFSRAGIGGTLMGPVIDLVAGIFDMGMALLQGFMDGSSTDWSFSGGFSVEAKDFKGKEADYGMDVDSNESATSETINAEDLDHGWFGLGSYAIPVIKYGPEQIFSNKVPGLDANFINPTDWGNDEQNEKSVAKQLQQIIASWYNALRNLVVVGLLSILVYIGIRMMITSIASDKAKYKQMFMDWLIALCLVFFLHYVMSFTMTVTQMITDGIAGSTNIKVTIEDKDITDGKIEYVTNLTGLCRLKVEYNDFFPRGIHLILYIALVIYTVKFTLKYIERTITMAFLTLMAPLVTLTYPIDKIGDGKAQAFDMWLKEFVFNALLQPFHLILYTVFLGSSMEIAKNNPIYAIVVLAFMGPAEKILRRFFGFEKAATAGAGFMGGFGGAAAFNAIKGAVTKGAQKLGSGNSGNTNSSKPIRQQNSLNDPVKDDNAPSGYGAFANNEMTENEDKDKASNSLVSNTQENSSEQSEDNNTGLNDLSSNNNATQEDMSALDKNTRLQNVDEPQKGGNTATRTIKGAARGVKNYVGTGLKKRFATKAGWKDTGKRVGRAAIRTVTTGTGLAVGLGAGIAGDDLSDIFKYGAAGTTLGTTALNSMVNGVGSRIANSGIVNAAIQGGREGRYGGVNAAAIASQTAQLKEAGELRQSISENITNDDGTRLSGIDLDQYEDRAIGHFNNGIDFNDINKTLKLEDSIREELSQNTQMSDYERNITAQQQAETIAMIGKNVDADKLATDEKYRNGRRDDFRAGLLKANPEMSKKELNANTEKMMKLLCKYKKVNYTKD